MCPARAEPRASRFGSVKVLVAPDSFKGSMTAAQACAAIQRGILSVLPRAGVTTLPMADGGEGTADVLRDALGGEHVRLDVTGPLADMRVDARYVWLPDGGPDRGPGGLVEMARASGIELLTPEQLDPMRATTFGTGELIAAAASRGARRLWLAIGGSATVDGGTGMARALGWSFLDDRGQELGPGGGPLERLDRLVPPERPIDLEVRVLCDVDNPLLGSTGAARVFGPQKGATPPVVERLEAGLSRLADVLESQLGLDVRDVPGGGAAGGLGAGAVAFLGAELVPGAVAVSDAVGLATRLESVDWVVTGEGKLDRQSLHGKVVSAVRDRAKEAGSRVAVLAGQTELSAADVGVDAVDRVMPEQTSLPDALARGEELLEEAAARFAKRYLVPPT